MANLGRMLQEKLRQKAASDQPSRAIDEGYALHDGVDDDGVPSGIPFKADKRFCLPDGHPTEATCRRFFNISMRQRELKLSIRDLQWTLRAMKRDERAAYDELEEIAVGVERGV